jgi:hypothetical protein
MDNTRLFYSGIELIIFSYASQASCHSDYRVQKRTPASKNDMGNMKKSILCITLTGPFKLIDKPACPE